jgi:catechol 2,3-dioxygenase-like lactoylglutathione lyase family enzyme
MIQHYGLSHIQLAVSDLDRSVRFYQGIFGMEELFRLGPHAIMLRTPGTNEVFTLNAHPDGISCAGTMGGIAHFGFRVKEELDIPTLTETVTLAGGKAIEHGRRGKDQRESYMMVSDPDGYEIELFWMPSA